MAFGMTPAPAQAGVSADINIHIGRRAPVYYTREPRVYAIPSSEVYYVQDENDCDTYRYGNDWYVNDGGNWYCGQSWRGPFVQVAYARVPRVILQVPGRYHRQTRGYWQGGTVRHDSGWNDNDRRYRSGGRNDGQWNGRTDGRQWNDNDRRDRNDGRQWNDGNRRDRNDREWSKDDGRGQGHGKDKKGRGNGRGQGRGNGNGHGRG
jgi:hypothetical protein